MLFTVAYLIKKYGIWFARIHPAPPRAVPSTLRLSALTTQDAALERTTLKLNNVIKFLGVTTVVNLLPANKIPVYKF